MDWSCFQIGCARRMGCLGSFQTVSLLILLGGLLDYLAVFPLQAMYGIMMANLVKPGRDKDGLRLWQASCLVLALVYQMKFLPMIVVGTDALSSGCLMGTPLESYCDIILRDLNLVFLCSGSAGVNSKGILPTGMFDGLSTSLGALFNNHSGNPLYRTVTATFLRSNDISADLRKIDDIPSISHEQVVQNWKASISQMRTGVLCLVLLVFCAFLPVPLQGLSL